MKKLLLLLSSLALLPLAPIQAQDQIIQPDAKLDSKLERYHTILLKRPSSTALFQKFQSAWLAQHNEASLHTFLENKATSGTAQDKLLFAYLSLQQGKELQALNTLKSAAKQAPQNPQIYLDRAIIYSRLLDFDKAAVDIQKAITLSDENAPNDNFLITANKLKGRFLTRQGKTDEAVAHWNKLAKDNPNDQDLIEDVIDILMEDSLAPAALKLATTLRDNTKDPYKRALRSLRIGSILIRQGERDKALETYLTTLRSSGSNSWLEREIIAQVQSIYTQEDNTNGLIEQLQKLAKTYPQRNHIKLKLAETLVSSTQFDKAKSIYQTLIKTNPGDETLRAAYFAMLKVSRDFIAARQLIDSMIKADPNNPQLQLQRASLSHQMQDKKSTLNDLNSYLKLAKPSPATATRYASLLNKYQFKKEAIAAYKKAYTDFPKSLDTALTTAKFLHFNEQKDQALEIWKKLALAPQSKSDLVRILDALLFNNQPALALQAVKQQYPKNKTNISFLQAAIKVAETAKQYTLATDYSYTFLLLATNNTDIDNSVSAATRNIIKSNKTAEYITTLTKKQTPSLSEKFLLINLHEQNGELKTANDLLAKLATSDHPIALLQAAKIYQKRYNLDKASASLEKLITLPNSLKAVHLRQLSDIYKRAGKINKALAIIQKWKTLAPNNKQVWIAEVNLLEDTQGPETALQTLRKGIQKFENDPEIFAKLADLNSQSNRHSQAKLLYWRLYDDAENLPDRIRWASLIAQNSVQDDTTSELIDKLNTRRRSSPQAIAPIMSLAEVYRIIGKTDELRKLLLEATRLRPEDPSLLLQIASIDEKNGDIKNAMETLRKAQKFEKNGNITRKLAKLMMEEGDYSSGLEELTKLNVKNTARTVEGITLSLIQQDALEEAQEYLTKQLPQFPEDWRLLLLKSIIENNLGYNEQSFATALKLLYLKNKLPTPTQGWSAQQPQYARALNISELPPEYADFTLISGARRNLNALTNNNSNQYYGIRTSSASGVSQYLPSDIRSLHLMAKAQIIQILSEFSDQELEPMIKEANAAGFKHIKLIGELYPADDNRFRNNENLNKVFTKYLAEQPNSKFITNLAILSQLEQGKLTLAPKVLKQARKLNADGAENYFTKTLPFFAPEGTSPEKHSEQVIKLIKQDSKINDQEIIYLFMLNRGLFDSDSGTTISKSHLDILKRYKKENTQEQQSASTQTSRSQYANNQNGIKLRILWSIDNIIQDTILKSKDYKKIIPVIENIGQNNIYNYSFGGGRSQAAALTFPPSELTHVSSSQSAFFRSNSTNDPFIRNFKFPKEKIEANLELFKNPILKIVAAHYADENKDLTTFFDTAKAEEKYKADAHLLEAAYQVKMKKGLSTILNSLNLARQNTTNKQQRISINNYIFHAALASTPEDFKKLTPKLQELVQSTARRLMIQKKVTEPESIKKALATFSMEKETSRFLTKQNQSIRQANVAGRVIGNRASVIPRSSSSNQRQDLAMKVKEAVQKKRTTHATNLLITKFKSILRNSYSSSYELKSWKKIATENNLQSEIINKLDPRESTSPKRWLNFYKATETLEDKKAQAKAIKYLNNMPRVPNNVKAPLAIAIHKENPKKALELLKASRNPHKALDSLHNQLDDQSNDPKSYTRTLSFTVNYLSSLDPDSTQALQNENHINNTLRTAIQITQQQSKNSYNRYKKTKDKKLIAEQKQSLSKLLNTALNYPQSADAAFILLQSLDPKKKSNQAKYRETAKASLLKTSQSQQLQKHSQYYGISYGSDIKTLLTEKTLSENLDRYQYISQEIIRTGKLDILDDSFLESIKDKAPKIFTRLEFLKSNLLLDEKDLAKNIQKLTKSKDFGDYLAWHEFLKQRKSAKISALYSDQFLEFMLKTPTLEMSRTEASEFFNSQSTDFLKILHISLPEITKAGKQKVLIEILGTLADQEFKGVSDKSKKWNYLQSTTNYSQQGFRQFILYNLMTALTADLATFRHTIPLIQKYEYDISSNRHSIGNRSFPKPTDLYAQFQQAGYLTTPDKLKLTKLPTIKSTSNRTSFPSFSNNKAELKYDLQYLAKQYQERQYYNNNRTEFQKFIKLLYAAPAAEKYGAQLTLVLMEELPVVKFIENNAKSFAKVPKDQRAFLQEILSINTNPKLTAAIQKHKLEALFPIDKTVLLNKTKADAEKILQITTIKHSSDLNQLEQNLVSFLREYMTVDIKSCGKVFSHYLSLLDKHQAINTKRFDLNTLSRSPFQDAVEKNVLKRLYIDKDTQHESLRLLYLLSKDPLSHKLGFRTMIQMTIPLNWAYKMDKKNFNNGQKLILLNSAKKYNALTDPDEKSFFRAAWSIYVYTNHASKATFFYIIERTKKFHYLAKKHPEAHELVISTINPAGQFQDMTLNNVIGHYSCYHNDYALKLQWIKNYQDKFIPKLFKVLNSYKPQTRAAVLAALAEQIGFNGTLYQFPQFTDLYLDALEKILKEQPNLVCSHDTRFMLQRFKHSSLLSSAQKIKIRSLGSLILNQQVAHLKNNNFVHHNHIINATCMLAIDKTGAEELIEIYRQNPSYFIGNVEFAHTLLRYGYLKEIKQILQKPSSRTYYDTPRVFANDDSEKNLTELLKLYKSNTQKAQVAGLLFLPNNYDLSKPPLMSPQQRVARLADLTVKAKQESKNTPALYGCFAQMRQYADVPTLKKLIPFYKDAELRDPKLLETLYKASLSSYGRLHKKRDEYMTYLKYLILSGQHEKYLAQVKLVRSLYHTKRRKMHKLGKAHNIAITYEAVYAIMLEYYADPKKDQELKELLPLIRKVNAISLTKIRQIYRFHYNYNKVLDPCHSSLLLSKFIHQELGEEEAWATWVNSLPPKLKHLTNLSGQYSPLCFMENIHILGDGWENMISQGHIPLLQRILNNKAYQHYTINTNSHNRGNINVLIEYGFIHHQQAEILLKKLKIKYHYPEFEAMMLRDANFIHCYTGDKEKIIQNCRKIREILLKNKGPKEAKGTNYNLIDAMATLKIYNMHQESLDYIPRDATSTFNNKQRKRYNHLHGHLCRALKIKPNLLTNPKKKKPATKKQPADKKAKLK